VAGAAEQHLTKPSDVAASGEGPTRAGEHDRAHPLVRNAAAQRGQEVAQQRWTKGVQRLGAFERKRRHAVLERVPNQPGHGLRFQ
jgi:hypothetical protein